MLKQLSIKREYLLVAASILLLIISYHLAFKKTIEAWQEHNRLNKELMQSAGVDLQPAYLNRKNHNIGQIINFYKTDTVAFRSSAISAIASIAEKENVKLSEVPTQDPIYHTDKFIIQKLDFEGDYFALTRMLNQLQATKGIGVCRSATFRVITTRTTVAEVKKLVLEVYLETVK
ncbi:hypothetical protein [Mucilaginibacter gotjawali]|uniref:Uncharacterized protein n=2 Tax=Mucilaginibacter gotjawali TaxID=1550579 RepID=A0A0X8X4E1_9SPHI|nr:hypothetical protein [Mucilaginibacter gotjawali]MBB3059154.1 hypothetical protein [Mucilaginibacter gotjawali]BAU54917.1 hypothetical protein MgSA37_03096 [Mucilaginibacter gotjawali]